jgi:hypothetical protein
MGVGKISSIDKLRVPEGIHVRDFDEQQRALRRAARAMTKKKPNAHNFKASQADADLPKALNLNASQIRATPVEGLNLSGQAVLVSQPLASAIDTIPTIEPKTLVEKSIVDLHEMVLRERELLAIISRAGQEVIKKRLMVIFEELGKRYEAGEKFGRFTGRKAMGAYLRSVGIQPGKLRVWKFLLRKDETAALAGEVVSPAKRKNNKQEIDSESEAHLLAKAGLKIAEFLAGENMMSPGERVRKAEALAQEMLDSRAGGQYDRLEQEETKRRPSLATPESRPTLRDWQERKYDRGVCKRKYFAEAADHLLDRIENVFTSAPFEKVLGLVGDPDYADDLLVMSTLIQSAAKNLLVLAAAMQPDP